MIKNNIVKIPRELKIFYSEQKKIILIQGPSRNKLLKLSNKLNLNICRTSLKITINNFVFSSKKLRKKTKTVQFLMIALLKKVFLETSNFLCKKFQFIGVGYKVFRFEMFNKNLLQLKLGFSHLIYLNIPNNLKVHCFKSNTKIYVFGYFYTDLLRICALLRGLKKPEPYKGKGILYENECVALKEGKKI